VKLTPGLPWQKQHSKRRLCRQQIGLKFKEEIVKCYILSIAFYGSETWTLRQVNEKYLESFKMCCWRRMGKIIWTDYVRSEEVLHRVKEDRNILHTTKRRKATCSGHILRRNCLTKYVIRGKIVGGIEVTGRQGKNVSSYWMTLRKREDTEN
jgi:hypothetical protein